MPTDVAIPEMGESVSEVILLEWLKSEGDYVGRDEPLCVLETDKANVELPSPVAGVLHPIQEVDATLSVGDVLATIDEGPPPDQVQSQSTSAPAIASAGTSQVATEMLESLSPAVRGLVEEHGIDTSEIVGTGRGGRMVKQDIVAYIKEMENEAASRMPAKSVSAVPAAAVAARAEVVAPPPVASVPTPQVAPVEPPARAPSPVQHPAQDPVQHPSGPAANASQGEGVRREPMSKIRKRIAERLVAAQQNAAMLTTFNEVDLGEVMALRKRHKERFAEKHGVSLGLMSFFSRATILALQEFPQVNAGIEGTDIVYHDYVNLGIAVSSDRGLLVPVLRRAERLSMAQVEGEIKRLAKAARDNKLSLDELSGGTFSITNGGVFGSLMSTPILNPPQSAILGMHAIKERAVVVDGAIVARPMMYLALSYDHRLIDGEQSVKFLVRIKELLEDPPRLMLEI